MGARRGGHDPRGAFVVGASRLAPSASRLEAWAHTVKPTPRGAVPRLAPMLRIAAEAVGDALWPRLQQVAAHYRKQVKATEQGVRRAGVAAAGTA